VKAKINRLAFLMINGLGKLQSFMARGVEDVSWNRFRLGNMIRSNTQQRWAVGFKLKGN